jgi:hypothetical protein
MPGLGGMNASIRRCWPDSKRSRDSVAQMSGRCSGGQAEMSRNFGNHRRVFDGGDDFQGTAPVRAGFDVDIEYPFTKALPGFRPSGRCSPFKTAPGGFVSNRAQLMRPVVQ